MRLLLIVILTLPNLSINFEDGRSESDFMTDYLSARYPDHQIDHYLLIKVRKQTMTLVQSGEYQKTYAISTASKGIGNVAGSEKTPVGLHKIAFKLGDDVPIGGIIKGRSYTGEVARIYTDTTRVNSDQVLTRAIRLEGLEEGFNKDDRVDTYSRYIYIHGTPEEGLIGKPSSHGCIRMLNQDIVRMFDQVHKDDFVVILNL